MHQLTNLVPHDVAMGTLNPFELTCGRGSRFVKGPLCLHGEEPFAQPCGVMSSRRVQDNSSSDLVDPL